MNLYKNSSIHKLAVGELEIKSMGILKVIGFELLYLLLMNVMGLVPIAIENIIYGDINYYTWIGTVGTDIIAQSIVILIILKMVKTIGNENGIILERMNLTKRDYLCAAGVVISYSLIRYGILDEILMSLPYLIPDELVKMIEEILTQSSYVILFVQTVVIAPIFEEIMYRGVFLNGMLKRYSPKKAIILSSLVFGFVHLNLPQGLNAFVLGLIFAVIYYYTRSLYLCMFMHAVNNFVVDFIYVPEIAFIKIVLYILVPIIGIFIVIKCKKELNLKERFERVKIDIREKEAIIEEGAIK